MRAAASGASLGLVDHRDHLLVGVAGIVVEGEDAVLEQDHAGAGRLRSANIRSQVLASAKPGIT